MIDSVMALCMLMIGVCALLSILPLGWRNAGDTDLRSRAADIMHAQLERAQELLMNPCNVVNTGTYITKTVYSEDLPDSRINAGDRPFQLTTQINSDGNLPPFWTVNVTVTWPGNSNGISAWRNVMWQESSRYPASVDVFTCPGGLTNVSNTL